MSGQIQLDVDVTPTKHQRKVTRTISGQTRASDLKAIQWYVIEHTLKLVAIAVWHEYQFVDRDGEQKTVHLGDILDEYDAFKKRTHGRKVQA